MISEKDFKNNLGVPNGPIGKKGNCQIFSYNETLSSDFSLTNWSGKLGGRTGLLQNKCYNV